MGDGGFFWESFASAARRRKGVVKPQQKPTARKPATQRQTGGDVGIGSSVSAISMTRKIWSEVGLETVSVGCSVPKWCFWYSPYHR